MRPFSLLPGDLDDPRVAGLLLHHMETGRAQTAPGSAHALDLSGLRAPDIAVWTLWADEAVVATGALRRLSATEGEVKAMHTAAAFRRRGAGRRMLSHLIEEARAAGFGRLSLETGASDYFIPSRALYAVLGFRECGAFGSYRPDSNSIFMTLRLDDGAGREKAGGLRARHGDGIGEPCVTEGRDIARRPP
jgi:putative acetyltransferase